ncbi:MAG: TolC family protein [Verrucomicrobiales bacterium]|nr:TolC family protein [Verrucomicrobiales bacterium]
MNKHKLSGLSLLLGMTSALLCLNSQGETMTLNEAICRALEHDPTIKKIYADVMSAEGYSKEIRAERRPQLTLSSDAGYGYRSRSIGGLATGGNDLFDRRAGLILEQLIWDNGFSCHKWKDAKCRQQAAVLLVRAQKESTVMGTVAAYLAVLKARKQIDLARRNVASHQKFFSLARDRANGAGNAADVELSQARLNLAKSLLKERELDLNQAEADFARFVCVKPPALCQPHVPTIRCIGDIDPTENFHYKAALHQCKAAQLANAAIRKSHGPQVLLRGTGSYGQDVLGIQGEDEEVSALVVMNWNLLEGGRRKGLEKKAEGDIAKQVAIVDETKVLLNRDIKARWADYSTLGERIAILENYTRGLGETVGLYQQQFELDSRPLLGVLDIENEKISSEMRLVDERYEREVNAYRLLFFGGKITCATVGEEHLCRDVCISLDCPGTDCLNCMPSCEVKKISGPSVSIQATVVATPVEEEAKKKTFKLFQGIGKGNSSGKKRSH